MFKLILIESLPDTIIFPFPIILYVPVTVLVSPRAYIKLI
nr:MAG TPA: hypothetical protein [Bacteriophage sp.]